MQATQTTAIPSLQPLPPLLSSGLQLKQLPALDGLRAIAVFLVVLYHSGLAWVPGGLGVLVFFVLSGFLITWLLLEEQDRYGAVSLKLFYARRTLRIFPAFYAYWALMAARGIYTHKILWVQTICAFFYVNNYYQAFFGDPNWAFSHTWSLGVEEQFYLLWPASFLFLQRLPRERVVRILWIAILAVWIYRPILRFVFGVDQGYIYEAFDTRADHLLCGCLLAFVLRSGAWPRLWKALCSTPLYSALISAMLVGSVMLANRFGVGYRDSVGFVLDPVLVALLIPQLIAWRQTLLWSWLNWPWMRYLGRISYSLYLYQQITPGILEKLLPHAGKALFVCVNALLVTIVATGSYFVIEKPFLKLKGRFARVRHAPA